MNFCPPASSGGGKAFPQFLPKQEGKTEKFSLQFFIRAHPIFFSIKETKIFLFCPPSGGRKRWAGINPQNPLGFAQNGFGFRPTNTTKLN